MSWQLLIGFGKSPMPEGCEETIVGMKLLNQVALIMDNPKLMENPRLSVRVAAAGEALIDLIVQTDGKYEPCLGGAVFNLTRALARQDVGVLYLNPLSGDRFGRQLAASLFDDGVQLARTTPVGESTSLAVVGLDDNGHPDYAFYREHVADRAITADQLNASCHEPSLSIVCTGALALAPDDAVHYLPWLRTQRDAGRVIVVDANLRPSVMPDKEAYRRNVHATMQMAHLVKVSDEDLENLAVPGATALARAHHVMESTSARLLLLTLGEQGAWLLTRDGQQWHAREATPVAVVDTVGAGDCFLAGFLAAWLRLHDDTSAAAENNESPIPAKSLLASLDDTAGRHLLAHAVASASLCIMRRGCAPPTSEEVKNRVVQVPCTFG
jgi:fructokinase